MESPDGFPARVGRHLAERREDLDLTQNALAQRIGITSASVSAVERGVSEIRRSLRARWETALRLRQGTITRAYNDGTPLDVVAEGDALPYPDPDDPTERALWNMALKGEYSKDVARAMIDLRRREREQKQQETPRPARRRAGG
jgi:transcriptional regulator with XRE-family HTH domain